MRNFRHPFADFVTSMNYHVLNLDFRESNCNALVDTDSFSFNFLILKVVPDDVRISMDLAWQRHSSHCELKLVHIYAKTA